MSEPLSCRKALIAAKCVAIICVASMPSVSSRAAIPVTAANASLISPDPGGCDGPPPQAALMMPLSIKVAKPGSAVPNADMSRTASIGWMSMLSGLPGTDLTVIFGAILPAR